MIRALLFILLLSATSAFAEVYRWVDALGHTQFSDRPQPGAEAQSKAAKPKAAQPATNEGATTSPGQLGPYRGFEIVSPEANQTLRQETGSLPVSLIIEPPLLAEHRLELLLDGVAIRVTSPLGTQLALNGVPYGSHVAQARILDPQGNLVARTKPVNFHLRKPIPPGVIQ